MAHPGEDGRDFLLWCGKCRNNCIRKALQVSLCRVLPNQCVEDEQDGDGQQCIYSVPCSLVYPMISRSRQSNQTGSIRCKGLGLREFSFDARRVGNRAMDVTIAHFTAHPMNLTQIRMSSVFTTRASLPRRLLPHHKGVNVATMVLVVKQYAGAVLTAPAFDHFAR